MDQGIPFQRRDSFPRGGCGLGQRGKLPHAREKLRLIVVPVQALPHIVGIRRDSVYWAARTRRFMQRAQQRRRGVAEPLRIGEAAIVGTILTRDPARDQIVRSALRAIQQHLRRQAQTVIVCGHRRFGLQCPRSGRFHVHAAVPVDEDDPRLFRAAAVVQRSPLEKTHCLGGEPRQIQLCSCSFH